MITETPPAHGTVQTVWWIQTSQPDPNNMTDPIAFPETATGKLKSLSDDPDGAKQAFCEANGLDSVPGDLGCSRRSFSSLNPWELTRLRYLK